MTSPATPSVPASPRTSVVPGLIFAAAGAGIALLLGRLLPVVPVLTIALVVGIAVGQVPVVRRRLGGVLAPGTALAARGLLRVGIVLLGFKLSLTTVLGLGGGTIALVILLVVVSFLVTWGIGRILRLSGRQPLMMAAGFSICGVSAIGAVGGTVRAESEDTATPIAMVTLFGSLGIVLLPVLAGPLHLAGADYGVWVGASLHDVGQVVAAGGAGGAAALAIAVTVKLTRVIMLAPMVAAIGAIQRRSGALAGPSGKRPPIVPLFIVLFVAVVVLNSVLPVPAWLVEGVDAAQTVLFAAALFAIGWGIRLLQLVRSGGRAVLVGILSWAVICTLALGIVWYHAAA